MTLIRETRVCTACAMIATVMICGCTQTGRPNRVALVDAPRTSPRIAGTRLRETRDQALVVGERRSGIVVAGFEMESESKSEAPSAPSVDELFAGTIELDVAQLVAAVESRNPTLQAAQAAWAAAAERAPQVTALEDPLLQSMLAPRSLASSSNVQSSYYVGISQKIPWSGKRELRGQVAQSEANATAHDWEGIKQRLVEATRVAFFDYYLVRRELELNSASVTAIEKFRRTANDKYIANQVTQQDVLQADVELAKAQSRRIELEQTERVVVARLNTLLHRNPEHPLPPPPSTLAIIQDHPSASILHELALEHRPDLSALAARIQAEQAGVELACKEFYPDFEFMGRYDQFWTDHEQRPQVGMNVNIPLNQSRRRSAVREAMFRLNKLQHEYQERSDAVRNDVTAALARLDGAGRTARLYAERIIPVARDNVAAAEAGYIASQIDFLRLVAAQRELIELLDQEQQQIAEHHRRRAELERELGTNIPVVATEAGSAAVLPADTFQDE